MLYVLCKLINRPDVGLAGFLIKLRPEPCSTSPVTFDRGTSRYTWYDVTSRGMTSRHVVVRRVTSRGARIGMGKVTRLA